MALTAVVEMAKKQAPKNAGGRPFTAERMVPIASLRGKKAFADWFERLAAHCRLTGSTALEHGLIELAKARGFTEPPPER